MHQGARGAMPPSRVEPNRSQSPQCAAGQPSLLPGGMPSRILQVTSRWAPTQPRVYSAPCRHHGGRGCGWRLLRLPQPALERRLAQKWEMWPKATLPRPLDPVEARPAPAHPPLCHCGGVEPNLTTTGGRGALLACGDVEENPGPVTPCAGPCRGFGTLGGITFRAPGSVKVRTGGHSPRPAVVPEALGRRRLNRWNSGTDSHSLDGSSTKADARLRASIGAGVS